MCLCVFVGTVWGGKMASTCSEKRNFQITCFCAKNLKEQYTKSSSIGYVRN